MAGKPMRVLHVLGSMNPGGVETWLLSVLEFIDRNRFKFDICTFGPNPGLHAKRVKELGGTIVPCPRNSNPLSFRSRFRRILRDGRYDVVHSHVGFFSGVVLRWAKTEGVRVRIAHSHNSRDDKPNTITRKLYRRLMKFWIDRYATRGLAASRPAAELFGNDWRKQDFLRVLYYGIDLSQFEGPVVREKMRQEFGIAANALVVGHVGRFDPQKNHSFLLDIARKMISLRPNVHFLLVGDGYLRPLMQSRAKALGIGEHVHFTGIRTDVPRLMVGAMDILVFPSLWEGLPVTIIEAQAAGLKCLVSNVVAEETVALSEVVKFLPVSAGSGLWAEEAMKTLDSADSAPSRGWKRLAKGPFDIKEAVQQLEQFYESQSGLSAMEFTGSHA